MVPSEVCAEAGLMASELASRLGIDLGAYEAWASRLVRVQDEVVMRPGEPLCPWPRELLRLLVEQHGTDSSPSRRQAVTEGRS